MYMHMYMYIHVDVHNIHVRVYLSDLFFIINTLYVHMYSTLYTCMYMINEG